MQIEEISELTPADIAEVLKVGANIDDPDKLRKELKESIAKQLYEIIESKNEALIRFVAEELEKECARINKWIDDNKALF